LDRNLRYSITSTPLPKVENSTLSLRLDTTPTDVPPHTIQKSTSREIYDSAHARAGADYTSKGGSNDPPFDALLWNTRGDVTETSIANFAVFLTGSELESAVPGCVERAGGIYVTPASDKGLIAGVMRAELLQRGELVEGNITKADVLRYI
jgi:branched-subunit amino acid aminotransferase/4-amino-4-deoxychorismate lyase